MNQLIANEESPAAYVNRWIVFNYIQKLPENSDNNALCLSPLEIPIPATIVGFMNPHVNIRLPFA